MTKVFTWPPVGVTASEWTVLDPINRSASLMTGRLYESAAQRRRRAVHLEVSALANGRSGAGYMEVLKRLLEGGIHKVRLSSRPINWHIDAPLERAGRQASVVTWRQNGQDVGWTESGNEVTWLTGTILHGARTTSNSMPAVRVSGLEAGRLAVRAGEFVQVVRDSDDTRGVSMAVSDVFADDDGEALIRLTEALPFDGRVNLGVSEGGIFSADSLPRAVQPVGQDWSYAWDFTEVFTDELVGPIEV